MSVATVSLDRAIQGSNIMLGNPVLLTGLQYSTHLNNHTKCHALPHGLEKRLPWASPEMIRQVLIVDYNLDPFRFYFIYGN